MTRQQFIDRIATEQESLRRFLRGLCGGDAFRADDIAQEALLKAYLSFERFEGRSRFSTWLFRIAYNCWHDHLKKSSKESGWNGLDNEAAQISDDGSSPDRRFEHQDLYLAISGLNHQEKAVILLFYMEDKSIKEIVEIMDMPSGTIRSHLSRGRKHLKEHLFSYIKDASFRSA